MGPSWAILAAAWVVGQPPGGPVASRPDLLIATQLIASPDLFSDRIRTLWSAREPIERVEEVLREEFARGAPLALRSAAELGLDPFELRRCNEAASLACWLRATQRYVEGDDGRLFHGASYIFVLSTRRARGEHAEVTALLIPLERELVDEANRTLGRDDALEDAIFAASVALDGSVALNDLESWRALARDFAARATPRVRWPSPRLGTLSIRAPRPGLSVELDGQVRGILGPDGRLSLTSVIEGPHQLALHDPTAWTIHQPLAVRVGTATVTHVEIVLADRSLAPSTYGGLGLVAAGAALITYGLLAPRNQDVCLGDCSRTFVSFGEGDGRGSPVLIVPLGYSLALTGASWAVSPLLFDDLSGYPWVQLALSLAAGALSYSISAGLGG